MLARCFELLARNHGVIGVVSFSDPVPRAALAGETVMPGHVGTIYQALNGRYLGRSSKRTLRLLPDGRVFGARAIQKIRAAEDGWLGAAELLAQFGVSPVDPTDLARARLRWLHRALARVTTPFPHPGCHRYAWVLDRRHRRTSQPYGPDVRYPKEKDSCPSTTTP